MFRLGIERIDEYAHCFEGKRLGMITSASGTDQALQSSVSMFHDRFPLVALYGPEHGVRGAVGAGEIVEGMQIDAPTGLPVYSLYRKDSQHFTPEMLDLVDTLVYDIQDLGLRFYTYVSTLLYAMEDCAKAGKELIVLDRPNPLGGMVIEGGMMDASLHSFVGSYPMPIRYGLTAGEFALMANEEQKIGCQLTVVPMAGWTRDLFFKDLGYPFLMPSPSIPHFENAVLYAGTCLLEGTNLSEGRGTADPFALIGAPFIDGYALCEAVKGFDLAGVIVTPATFTPTASKHAHQTCQGVHLHLTDPFRYPAVEMAIRLIDHIRTTYPDDFAFLGIPDDFDHPMMDLLTGSTAMRMGEPIEALLSSWKQQSEDFARYSKRYWLYAR